jgi:hypothetical protein
MEEVCDQLNHILSNPVPSCYVKFYIESVPGEAFLFMSFRFSKIYFSSGTV